jgi:hypothetical protein
VVRSSALGELHHRAVAPPEDEPSALQHPNGSCRRKQFPQLAVPAGGRYVPLPLGAWCGAVYDPGAD